MTESMNGAKRFLFVMIEAGGNVPPQLGIARQLARRGHQVHVLGDPAILAEAEAAGCSFSAFRRAPHHHARDKDEDILRDWEVTNPIAMFARVADRVFFGPAEKYALDVLDEVERFRPDALAVDCMPYGASIGAEKSGLPTAVLMHMIYAVPNQGRPPMGMGFQPARGALSRLRDRVLRGMMTSTFDKGLPTLNDLRVKLGLAPLAHTFDQYQHCARVLVLTNQGFDYSSSGLPANVRYVGAQLDDPSWAEPWQPPWAATASEPLVLVALGSTYQNQKELTARVIAALGELPVRGLVTLGGVFSPSEFSPPSNVAVVRSAPHAAVLPEARVVVAHGGHGTVIKALSHGVPLVCAPLGRDQKDNAARAAYAGAGVTVKPAAGVVAIRRAVERVLKEPQFTQAARRLSEAIRRDTERGEAVRELEALAAQGAELAPAPSRAANGAAQVGTPSPPAA